jgi:hypothetical protein
MWHEDAPSKWIGAIPTPWAMMFALGLGVLTPQPEIYHAYGRVILHNFFYVIILIMVWCKPGWDKKLVNVTFYEFLRCPIL